ncbi:MAG: low molecular weight protein-tyrosine-phosphatase [Sphaerochaetaceae bacterium]|nr:low molecular weight phosphotyrosine protein phosphatase [Spirochaetales bacterium]MDY5500205.1 low molecular weight protein-tyrosine-phosphatase [Sphaerochaetaceae bacterium]
MTKILFVCHGNICRSPMAEFFCKDLVLKEGIADQFHIESAATTSEEIWNGRGNPVYPPAREVLLRHGINPAGKRARLMTRGDYRLFDYLVGMDDENLCDMRRIAGGDLEGKIYGLMDFVEWRKSGTLVAGSGRDVADPWYTRDFEAAWNDIVQGCQTFFAYVISNHQQRPSKRESLV